MADSNEELISQYIDRDGVKQDTDYMLDQINKVDKAFQRLNTISVSLGNVKGAKELSSVTKEAADSTSKLRKEVDELTRVEKQLTTVQEKLQASNSKQVEELTREKELLRQKNQELKNSVREQNAAEGSIEKLRATLVRLNREYDNLGKAQREAAEGTALKQQISGISEELKKLEGDTGRFQRNVGNYGTSFSGALKTLEGALEDVRKKMDGVNKSGKASQQVVEALEKEYTLLNQLVNNQANGFASATTELRNNEKALQQLAAAGLQNTEFYQQLLQQTAELKDNVGDLKAEIKNLSSDTKMLDGLIGTAQTLAGAYGIAEGAAALFGDENEELQKNMVKLQAVMTILNGLQSIQNALQKESSVMLLLNTARTKALAAGMLLRNFVLTGTTKAVQANTAATVANTAATNATTTATRVATGAAIGLRAALIATGIGALLVLLPMVVSAMSSFGDETDDAADSQEKLKERIEETKNELSDLQDQFDSYSKTIERQTKANLIAARARGASEAELSAIEQDGMKRRRQDLVDHKALLDERYANEAMSAEELKAINEQRVNVQGQIDDLDLEMKEKVLDRDEKISKKRKELADKAKEAADREFKARFELYKLAQQQRIDEQKAFAENDIYNDFSSSAIGKDARIKAREKQMEEERILAEAQRNFDLANTKLTAGEREVIIKKAAAAIKDIETQAAMDIIAIRKSITESERQAIDDANSFVQSEIEKRIQKETSAAENSYSNRLKGIEDFANAELKILLDQANKGVITKEEYEAQKLAIENKYRREALLAEIQYYEDLIKVSNLSPEKQEEALKKLNALRSQLRKDDLAEEEVYTQKKIELQEQLKGKIEDLAKQAFSTFTELYASRFDEEKNKVQESIDALEAKKQKDIEVVSQSLASEQKKANEIAIIEARALAEKEKLERNKRKIDADKARFEKMAALFNIGITTAQEAFKIKAQAAVLAANPITLPLVPMALAQIPFVLASGAMAAAVIAAKPIPKYFRGKNVNDWYEGPAIVGDGGKKELIIRENGSMEVTPDSPTLTYVRSKDIILPDVKQVFGKAPMQEINKTNLYGQFQKSSTTTIDIERLDQTMKKGLSKVAKTIEDNRTTVFHEGINKTLLMKYGSNWHKHI